ncbi:hypothetical protein F511_21265 [Dorcoceras hygrometricum]|uniref:Uncharacterized protein n=1 Tax=Dorcoceras hygrometricum TaxID=472368 RepID=A0A2Z7D890_9LAMI|nr:hypothetical protein F511_21265 [Dorcoceras hygrometricum]
MSRSGVVLRFELVSDVNPEVVGGCCSPDLLVVFSDLHRLGLRCGICSSELRMPIGGQAGNSRMPQLPAGICYSAGRGVDPAGGAPGGG